MNRDPDGNASACHIGDFKQFLDFAFFPYDDSLLWALLFQYPDSFKRVVSFRDDALDPEPSVESGERSESPVPCGGGVCLCDGVEEIKEKRLRRGHEVSVKFAAALRCALTVRGQLDLLFMVMCL